MPRNCKHLQHYFRLISLIFMALIVSACQTSKLSTDWPKDLPPLKIFVDTHAEQSKRGTNDSNIESHLIWVKRFYKGSIIYPTGWNDMVATITESFPPEQSDNSLLAKRKLEELGLRICLEWAQSNDKRKIDSSNIAIWGSALRTSVERQEQLKFIAIVEPDIDNLINGKLSRQEITLDRYYPPEDYDNF